MEFLKSINLSNLYFDFQFIIAASAVSAILYKITKYLFSKIKQEYDGISKTHKMISFIYSELTPNHGSSIKDKIDKIDKKIEENTKITNQICHRQRWILDNRDEPIFECDTEGKCTWVNEKYCQITKYSESYFLGNGWRNIIHEDDRERVILEWDSAIEDKRNSTCSYRIVNRDGHVYHVLSTATRNDVYGYIGSIKILPKDQD
jgi:PAS domain S-box-containing protein